jgi:hypothetical protein
MLNFFYYFYYRIREAHTNSGPQSNHAARAAYFTLVILLVLNGLSLYFLLIEVFPTTFVLSMSQDKLINRCITLVLALVIPTGVYWWYRYRQAHIEQALLDFRAENSDQRRIGGALIMGYIFSSCGLLIYAIFAPLL